METCATARRRTGAFTLIEIMVVVGIIGMIMAFGVPTLMKMMGGEGFRKTVTGFETICQMARARAIFSGKPVAVVFHPEDRTCELEGGPVPGVSGLPGGTDTSIAFGPGVNIQMLDVNMIDCRSIPRAVVRFFPNGTCDELVLVLQTDSGQWRILTLESTTGLLTVDSDPNSLRSK